MDKVGDYEPRDWGFNPPRETLFFFIYSKYFRGCFLRIWRLCSQMWNFELTFPCPHSMGATEFNEIIYAADSTKTENLVWLQNHTMKINWKNSKVPKLKFSPHIKKNFVIFLKNFLDEYVQVRPKSTVLSHYHDRGFLASQPRVQCANSAVCTWY